MSEPKALDINKGTKDGQLHIRVTKEAAGLIREKADALNMTVSDYITFCTLHVDLIEKINDISQKVDDLNKKVNAISNK